MLDKQPDWQGRYWCCHYHYWLNVRATVDEWHHVQHPLRLDFDKSIATTGEMWYRRAMLLRAWQLLVWHWEQFEHHRIRLMAPSSRKRRVKLNIWSQGIRSRAMWYMILEQVSEANDRQYNGRGSRDVEHWNPAPILRRRKEYRRLQVVERDGYEADQNCWW